MRKALFTAFAGLSLIMCIAMLILWVRSYWAFDTLVRTFGSRQDRLSSFPGYLVLYEENARNVIPSLEWRHGSPPPNPTNLYMYFSFDRATGYWHAAVPHWLIALFVSFPPIAWCIFYLHRRHLKRGEGFCRTCGYDLRASAERCPECGTPITPSPREGRGQG